MSDRILFALAVVVSLCFGYGHCWEQDLMFSLGINDDHLVIGVRGWFPVPPLFVFGHGRSTRQRLC